MTEYFHFLRPWWFLAIIPSSLIFILSLKKLKSSQSNWSEHCDPHLLECLLDKNSTTVKSIIPYLILFLWLITIFALAGPTWSLYGQPVYQKNAARIIALDVSQSMNATDISPSRLEHAKYKVLDLLKSIHEGQTGMIVFSSHSFIVSPLTSDTNTIASMVPILNTSIVPAQGSDINTALNRAAKLFNQAGINSGEIIIITDSTPNANTYTTASKLAKEGYTTSIIGIGTKNGGPITKDDGSMITDNNGNIVFASFDPASLEKLASSGNGVYTNFTNNNNDIETVLNNQNLEDFKNKPSRELQTKSLWRDEGHWLIWLLILLAAFLARRGWLEKLC